MGIRFARRFSIAAGICAAFVATPSLAFDYQLGALQTGVAATSGGHVGIVYNPSDRVFFSVAATNTLDSDVLKGSLRTLTPKKGSPQNFYLTSLTASLYTAAGAFVSSIATISGLATEQSTTLEKLAAGNYYISVSGTALDPKLGGDYALSLLTSQPAAAPGPAGILFVGGAAALMAARRRRQKAKAGLA
jgi:hypothetical protein